MSTFINMHFEAAAIMGIYACVYVNKDKKTQTLDLVIVSPEIKKNTFLNVRNEYGDSHCITGKSPRGCVGVFS